MGDGRAGGTDEADEPVARDPDGPRSRPRDDQRRRRPTAARRPVRRPDPRPSRAVRVRRLLGLSSTRRAAVLALVVCAVVLSVAVPLRNYLAQRGTLEETVRQQDSLREQVEGLETRKAQLSDPAHVEAEARERLRYVKPGETPFVVQLPPTTTPPPTPAETSRSAPGDEWYEQLWQTVAAPGS